MLLSFERNAAIMQNEMEFELNGKGECLAIGSASGGQCDQMAQYLTVQNNENMHNCIEIWRNRLKL